VQREVEVKFRIDDVEAVMAAFMNLVVEWSDPQSQDDQAYAPCSWSYDMDKIGVPFARLRTESGVHSFTVKTPQANAMDCIEHETTVADRHAMHEALAAMGFAPTVRIVKTRRRGTWGPVALCLDEVEHAGVFLELELLTEADPEVTQQQLADRVHELGIAGNRVTDTYAPLVRDAAST
jgi:adenylate cyclase, class 2